MNYDHILAAHPPLRDRMLYGLRKISFSIHKGVSLDESYFINCRNFEDLIEKVYEATTEDYIDVGDLDYEWQLSEASKKLESFVRSFQLYKIGLRRVFVLYINNQEGKTRLSHKLRCS